MTCYISVDIETAGPNPTNYAMLSIGACRADAPDEPGFYVELRPSIMAAQESALRVSGLSMARLAEEGVPAHEAMARFAAWLDNVVPSGQPPLFVGHNAPFDWMFVCDYFHRFLGYNPFGHAALDLKSLYMGVVGVPFVQTGLAAIAARYGLPETLEHHALRDAQDQARLLRHLLEEWAQRAASPPPPDGVVSGDTLS